jgi:hypothetical protein
MDQAPDDMVVRKRRFTQWLLGASILVVVALATLGGGLSWLEERLTEPARQFATLDRLSIPSSWENVGSVYSPGFLFRSWVARYYLVDADPDDLAEPAIQMIEDAGWEIDQRSSQDACSTNGPGGPMTCYVGATTIDDDSASIVIWDRDEDGTYYLDGNETRVASPGLSMVRVMLRY